MLEKVTLSNLYFKLHMHKQAHRLRPMMALFLTGMFFCFFFVDQIVLWSTSISILCIFHRGATLYCIRHVVRVRS